MANKIPVKAVYTGSDVTALGEFESGDTIDGAYISGTVGGSLAKTGGEMSGNITFAGSQTVDGRDLSADGTKLDGIEASANVTDTANVVASLTAGSNVSIAANGTISSTDTNTVYTVGDGGLTQKNFTTTLKSKLDGIEASANVTDTANVVAALQAGTNINIANDGTVSSTDTNTTYSIQDGELSKNNFTDADHTKLGNIETSADVTDTANVVAALTAGSNVSIAANGTISSTDTNTTYSVGNGGLTQNNFTDTLKTKLDGIEAGADHVDAANVESAGAVMVSNRTIQAESSGTPSGGSSGDIVYQY
tara:strand:- start:1160 stop:2080 length:921 start_codon:yes stop_codon:yes gene_type:complete